jgi:hypothetical protein
LAYRNESRIEIRNISHIATYAASEQENNKSARHVFIGWEIEIDRWFATVIGNKLSPVHIGPEPHTKPL